MPEIEIRPVVATDLPALVAIEHSFRSSYVWQMDLSVHEGGVAVNFHEIRLPRQVTVEYPRPPQGLLEDWKHRSAVLVGIYENVPVAYLGLNEHISPRTAWVTDLVVTPQLRRKGVATALIFAAQEWASQRDNRRMILELQSKNHIGIRLAMKLGFEFCGYNDHYYANQDIALFFAQFLR